MPRIARVKSPEFIYHIMCRSISEFDLFRDEEDKNYYLWLLKKYCDRFRCSVYAYCLMDNHLHLQLDPRGFDISKFMHCLNVAYVAYYNRKYRRHGHVFQGRFESRVISSDSYNLAVSAYIHNNPKDIEGYRGREYEYPFSSMGFYLGLRKDLLDLVDTGFILGLFGAADRNRAGERYAEFVNKQKDLATDKSIEKCLKRFAINEYKDERRIILRGYSADDILSYLSRKLGMPSKECVLLKSQKAYSQFREYAAFVLRALGGLGYKEICHAIGNISMSESSRLCSRGYELFNKRLDFRDIFEEVVKNCALV